MQTESVSQQCTSKQMVSTAETDKECVEWKNVCQRKL